MSPITDFSLHEPFEISKDALFLAAWQRMHHPNWSCSVEVDICMPHRTQAMRLLIAMAEVRDIWGAAQSRMSEKFTDADTGQPYDSPELGSD